MADGARMCAMLLWLAGLSYGCALAVRLLGGRPHMKRAAVELCRGLLQSSVGFGVGSMGHGVCLAIR